MKKIACVILCGGASKRMGQNKALLPFKESTLLEYQYQRLIDCKLFVDVFLSCKYPIKGYEEKCLLDHSPLFSPLSGLVSILKHSLHKKSFIITVDTPFVPISLIKTLLQQEEAYDALSFQDHLKAHPLIGIYHQNAYEGIKNMLHQKIYRLSHLKDFIDFKTFFHNNPDDFMNLNTPHDYYQALKQGA